MAAIWRETGGARTARRPRKGREVARRARVIQLARSGFVSASLTVTFEITFRVASSNARSPGLSDPSRLASLTHTLMSLTSVVESATNSAAVIRRSIARCAPLADTAEESRAPVYG